ncbi:MAG: hypothetical protein AB8B78_03690 [Polaribacter sp.]
MKLKNIFLIVFLTLLGCSETEEEDFNSCTSNCVIIDNNLYKNTKTNNYTVSDVKLNGDLLTIKINASGCDGNSWQATLVDANEIAESNPVQRYIKLSLENKEACLAVFNKDFTFNIKKLKENQTEIILNLEGWKTHINYK